ncbi:MAG TPA: YihY/virulence factor BrkB family protein [Kofleriaceae bacterium]
MAVWKDSLAWFNTSDSPVARWVRAAREALLGEMPVLSAGTALFGLIATVPALAAVVAIYGVAVDPADLDRHLKGLDTVMPQEVVAFISGQLERMHGHGVSLEIIGSLVAATIASRSSARSLIVSLNKAYRVKETRSALRRVGITLGMGLLTLIGLAAMFAILIALPLVIRAVGLRGYGLVRILRWPLLLALALATLAAMYRFAPAPRPEAKARYLWHGAGFATVLLVLVSWALSVWVDHIASYDSVYGAFGSLVVLMLWFYLSTVAVVIGGFINGELERQHR